MAAERATPLLSSLPDEIVIWEIIVRLDPKSLLRCRAVCRAWRCATSARGFLLAHHARQPAHPLLHSVQRIPGLHRYNIIVFDHQDAADAQLHTVARLGRSFSPEASCDGLLLLSRLEKTGTCHLIYNPATREHASLGQPWDFKTLGMYRHRPTGEYRLLLQRRGCKDSPKDQIGCYVLALGSDQPPRYIGFPDTALLCFKNPVQVRDSLHWYPMYYVSESSPLLDFDKTESELIIVFDTIAESFRHMRAPTVPTYSYIFEMDGTLGIHSRDRDRATINVWVLQNYESEVWDFKYKIQLPVAEIWRKFEPCVGHWDWNVDIVSGDGDVLLLVRFGGHLLHVDTDGKLINSFSHWFEDVYVSRCRLKQSLVKHTFFPALKGYAVNASPFV
ncbi:hypothetical protein VPH35_055419 [Triticum aestivum]